MAFSSFCLGKYHTWLYSHALVEIELFHASVSSKFIFQNPQLTPLLISNPYHFCEYIVFVFALGVTYCGCQINLAIGDGAHKLIDL